MRVNNRAITAQISTRLVIWAHTLHLRFHITACGFKLRFRAKGATEKLGACPKKREHDKTENDEACNHEKREGRRSREQEQPANSGSGYEQSAKQVGHNVSAAINVIGLAHIPNVGIKWGKVKAAHP